MGQLAGRVWAEPWADEILDRAAALSYYVLFALFPTLLFVTTLLGLLPVGGLLERLLAYAARAMPADVMSVSWTSSCAAPAGVCSRAAWPARCVTPPAGSSRSSRR